MNSYSGKIAITTGDPNGIGAEITIKALNKFDLPEDKIVLVSNKKIIDFYGRLKRNYEIVAVPYEDEIRAGKVTKEAGEFSFQALKKSMRNETESNRDSTCCQKRTSSGRAYFNGQTRSFAEISFS